MTRDNIIEVLPVPAPTMGIIGNVPTTMLNPRACVNCNNVVFKDGIVSPRTGYVAYGTGTITGILLLFFRYQKWNGQEYEMLATTTNVYYNDNGTWTSIASSLSGNVNTRASMTHIENYLAFTNGEDAPAKWDGTTWSALNAAHSGDAIDWGDYRPLIFLPFSFRLLGFNDNKVTTGASIRIMYSRAGNFDQIDGEEYSGYIEMTQGMGAKIVGAAPLKNYIGIYKDYCCALLSYIGGASTFAINVQIEGIGLAAKDAIANLGTSHMFLGSDYNIYRWNGGTELEPVGNPIRKLLEAEVNKAQIGRSFAVVNIAKRRVIFFLPINGDAYPTRMWIWNMDDESWAKGTISNMSAGSSVTKSHVERILIGTGGTFWDTVYDASVLPNADGWYLGGGSGDYASVSAGILTIDTSADVAYTYHFLKWPGINFTGGFTVKFKAQVVSSVGLYPFSIQVGDNVNNLYYKVSLRTDGIYYGTTKICDFDTTDAYHIYRIHAQGTTASLYIDDVLKGTWSLTSGAGGNAIIIGDFALGLENSTSSVNIKIDYLYYGDGDLDDPPANASAINHYDYAALDDDGTAISNDFETGDFVIDKIEHLIKNRRFFGLGLDLKGHSTSSRLSLEYSVDEGVTWLGLTEKELTAVYALYNWDFLKTTRKVRFRFSDDTSGQKWYLRFFGIKQKERERK